MQPLRKILVMKFGGTSVGTADAVKQVLGIIHQTTQAWPQLVVVTSALSGITDLLLECARMAASHHMEGVAEAGNQIFQRHSAVVDELINEPPQKEMVLREISELREELNRRCQNLDRSGCADPAEVDAIAGIGERMAARMLAGAVRFSGLDAAGIDATQLIVTDDCFGNAEPDFLATTVKTRSLLDPLIAQGVIPVVTGFIAATRRHIPTTLGRGGSDYSAAILAAALGALETWIWTDVDGVMTADPRLVPDARTIPALSFNEVQEMALLGAKVLHPKTILPILAAGGTLRVRNTFNPAHPGTLLIKNDDDLPRKKSLIKAVTVLRGQNWVNILQKNQYYNPIFQQLNPVEGSGSCSLFMEDISSEAVNPLNITPSAHPSLKINWGASHIGRIDPTGRLAGENADMVSIICPGLRSTPSISEQVIAALEKARIKILGSVSGASDLSMNLFIGSSDTQNAMHILHGLIQ